MTRNNRFLGVTVLGDYILSEGAENVLKNLQEIGATAVATNPTVTAPATKENGSFQPPTDAGSSPRVFDRPLFGQTSLWVRGGPSYHPDPQFYRDSPYSPRKPNDLTDEYGAVIGDFISCAVDAGLKVYFQLGAAQPSGLRDEDRPRLPNGELPTGRVADTASLASEAVDAYNAAYLRDLLAAYPQITGFRPDWPESPCYTLDECFQDFSSHVADSTLVKQFCKEHGCDFAQIQSDMTELYSLLNRRLNTSIVQEVSKSLSALSQYGIDSNSIDLWLQIKQELSYQILSKWRAILDEVDSGRYELSANSFMPPYNRLTGFDFARNANVCDAISPKLYTMHWTQMVEFWGRKMLESNPGVDESILVEAIVRWMGIDHDPSEKQLSDYGYPQPDEPHRVAHDLQRQKIQDVVDQAAGQCEVTPLVHGYGPPADFKNRLELVADSKADGVWVNRYGYLSDTKLQIIKDVWKA
ncbi:hypothetical protein [Thalassoroseus pseudoceratinae]|uniref:hypothetical protein n=1 Tax=Thalassoroseus pseudoceratinae TaxID=2713176 RepID=UPI0014233974|nr:hypothetical protein [Thalassoroseus pseudoceratinae]